MERVGAPSRVMIVYFFSLLTAAGCHSSHKVSARVESTGHCFPSVMVRTTIDGKAEAKQSNQAMPWNLELPTGLEDLRVDVFNSDSPGCTQVQCQITVDGKVTATHADPKQAICEWKP